MNKSYVVQESGDKMLKYTSLFDVTLWGQTQRHQFKLCANPPAWEGINVEQMALVCIFAQADLI